MDTLLESIAADRGRIAEQGPADSFFEAPAHDRTQQFLGAVMQSI